MEIYTGLKLGAVLVGMGKDYFCQWILIYVSALVKGALSAREEIALAILYMRVSHG